MTAFIALFAGFVFGLIFGFHLAIAGKLSLEKGYKQQGIAKIDGEYYKITKIEKTYRYGEGDK